MTNPAQKAKRSLKESDSLKNGSRCGQIAPTCDLMFSNFRQGKYLKVTGICSSREVTNKPYKNEEVQD
jgi:hypothetical protein